MTAALRLENTEKCIYIYTEKLRILMYVNEVKIIHGRGNTIHTIAS